MNEATMLVFGLLSHEPKPAPEKPRPLGPSPADLERIAAAQAKRERKAARLATLAARRPAT